MTLFHFLQCLGQGANQCSFDYCLISLQIQSSALNLTVPVAGDCPFPAGIQVFPINIQSSYSYAVIVVELEWVIKEILVHDGL